jgi:glycosyltransferase involved in cell wall biosynthesis
MRILFVSGLGGDTRRYRCVHHQQQLSLHGVESSLFAADDLQLYAAVAACDVLVLHRVAWSPLIADVAAVAHGCGAPVVFETDDLIFAPELFDRIAYLDTLPPAAAQRFRADLAGQVQTFAHCDCVLTTTEYLAQAAIERGKPAYIQRNAFSTEMMAAAERAGAGRRQQLEGQQLDGERRTFVLGYFSGTGSHNRDFATITPIVAELMGRYAHLRLHVVGHLDVGGALLAYEERIQRLPFVPWQELPSLLAQVDVNLAPLELDNPFCQAKSEIKYSEAALLGVPTVATPTQAFVYAMRHGATGLLAATPDEWRAALVRLIEDPAYAAALGAAARQAVYASYAPEVAAPALVSTLETILRLHAPRPAEPRQVVEDLAQRMLAHLRQQEQENAELQRQLHGLRDALAQASGEDSAAGAAFWRGRFEAAQVQHQAILRAILARLERKP